MSEELFEHHKLVADPGQQPLRVDKFLMNLIAHISRNKLQIAAKSGYIRVDGKPVKSNFKVKAGHVVTVELPQPVYEIELLPEEMDLDIVYEDNDILVINKQTDLVVHLAMEITQVLSEWSSSSSEHSFYAWMPTPRPGLVHRLDKDTTGLISRQNGIFSYRS